MNKRILYTNADGILFIIIPAAECGLTIEEIAAKDVPAGISYEIVDADSIPSDRTFRNAWKQDPVKKVDFDLDKARAIIRAKRNAKLDELDHQAIKEQRKPNGNVDAVNTEAQRLRNIPQDSRFNSTNIDDLKALHDEI